MPARPGYFTSTVSVGPTPVMSRVAPFRAGACEVRGRPRFGVEAAWRQGPCRARLVGLAVAEMPDAGDDRCGARVSMRMRWDGRLRRDLQLDAVQARQRGIAEQDGGRDARRARCARAPGARGDAADVIGGQALLQRDRCLFVNEGHDQRDRLAGLFLHDPVARIRDHRAAYIDRQSGELGFHRRSIGMIAADRQHRHLQFPDLREHRLVVEGIVGEGRELAAERVVDGPRPCVQTGVVLPGLLVDP